MKEIILNQQELVEAIADYVEKKNPTLTFEQVKLGYDDHVNNFQARVQLSNKSTTKD